MCSEIFLLQNIYTYNSFLQCFPVWVSQCLGVSQDTCWGIAGHPLPGSEMAVWASRQRQEAQCSGQSYGIWKAHTAKRPLACPDTLTTIWRLAIGLQTQKWMVVTSPCDVFRVIITHFRVLRVLQQQQVWEPLPFLTHVMVILYCQVWKCNGKFTLHLLYLICRYPSIVNDACVLILFIARSQLMHCHVCFVP